MTAPLSCPPSFPVEDASPPVPEGETARLSALENLQLLDTAPAPGFDRITALASRLFGVPIALVSLLDAERQWFKSCVGMELLQTDQTPRDIAFCAHAILNEPAPDSADEVFIVPDARLDARFQNNPLVTGAPYIRFYAGVPLRTSEGHALGTLCIIDTQPREFDRAAREILRDLAAMVMDEIALHDAHRRLRDESAQRAAANLRQSETMLRLVIDTTPQSIFWKNRDSVYLGCNRKFAQNAGVDDPAEIVGKTDFDLRWQPGEAERFRAADRRIMDSNTAQYQFIEQQQRADGSMAEMETSKLPLHDEAGNVVGVLGVAEDITPRRDAERALERAYDQLEERVAQRTSELSRANKRLEIDAACLSAVRDAQNAIATSDLQLRAVMQCVVEEVNRLTQSSGVAIQSVQGEELVCDAATGIATPFVGARTPVARSLTGLSLRQGEVLLAEDTELDARVDREACRQAGVRSMMAAPLRHGEHASWVLVVVSTQPNFFDTRDVQTLRLMLGLIAAAMSRSVEFEARQIALEGERAALSALRDSEAHFRALIENAHDIITILGFDGTILYESPSIERVLGFKPDDLVGTNATQWIHPDDLKAVNTAFARAMSGDSSSPSEFRFRHRDGSWRVLEAVGSKSEAGEMPNGLSGIVVNSRDVTERHRVEAERRQSESFKSAILETALDCIVAINAQGDVVEWNPAAEETFGFTREEVLGQPMHHFIIPPELREAHQHGLNRYLETGAGPVLGRRLEMPAMRKNGERITVELAVVPIPNTQPPLFTGHLRDISDAKRAEEDLRRSKEEADVARGQAESANLAKSQFLSRMSHELRTPLNAILGFSQIMQLDASIGELEARHSDMADDIHDAGKHLLSLINEVLDIARIEEGAISLSLEAVSLPEVVEANLSLIAPLADARAITIECDLDSLGAHYVRADRQRVGQVLINLLSNAVKYNREGGTIWIRGRVESEGTPHVRLEVSDSGFGLSSEQIGRAFTPFERLGAENTDIEGTGLGLALTRRLVEEMNGRIGVRSEVGQGSTFWFDLPECEAPPELATAPIAALPVPDAGNRTLLYIEDNPANLKVVAGLLNHRPGVQLLTAAGGNDGLKLAMQHHPDLILLDLHLPDIPGVQVLERLRQDEQTRDIPVVVLSADATPQQIERLLRGGADEYLTKPIDAARFLEVLNRLLMNDPRDAELSDQERRAGRDRRRRERRSQGRHSQDDKTS